MHIFDGWISLVPSALSLGTWTPALWWKHSCCRNRAAGCSLACSTASEPAEQLLSPPELHSSSLVAFPACTETRYSHTSEVLYLTLSWYKPQALKKQQSPLLVQKTLSKCFHFYLLYPCMASTASASQQAACTTEMPLHHPLCFLPHEFHSSPSYSHTFIPYNYTFSCVSPSLPNGFFLQRMWSKLLITAGQIARPWRPAPI